MRVRWHPGAAAVLIAAAALLDTVSTVDISWVVVGAAAGFATSGST